jgi:heme/copper-type cytochrome/quinol oxidase subunit 3
MNTRLALNLRALPTYGFGAKALTWWGTLAFIAIEGSVFAMAVGAYFYLSALAERWPPSTLPEHWPGSVMLALLLMSLWPNLRIESLARAENLKAVRAGLLLMSAIGLVAIAIRFYEFYNLPIKWYVNAYGSMLWFLLGLHATHLITDVGDTLVLTALMFTKHGRGKRFSDVSDNAFYWYFVVGAWVPLYFVIYWFQKG